MNRRGVLFTLIALALCWPAWQAAGWLVALLGLQAADPLLRFCALAAGLGLLDTGFTRLTAGKGDAAHG